MIENHIARRRFSNRQKHCNLPQTLAKRPRYSLNFRATCRGKFELFSVLKFSVYSKDPRI